MKKKLLIILFVGFIVTTTYWLYSHAFIEITPASTVSGEIKYTLTATDGKTTVFLASSKIKRIVRRGQYEILAQQGETSYFSVVKANGFLKTNVVSVKLSPEKSREFIGDNPMACMYYSGQLLASSDCDDLYSELRLHLPATTKQPTYTKKVSAGAEGLVEGVVLTSKGVVALLRSPTGDKHVAYLVQADFSLSNETVLSGLNPDKTYSMQSYKEGFVVYDSALSQVLYYSSPGGQPESINLTRPSDKKLVLYAIKADGNAILTAYSSSAENDVSPSGQDIEAPKSKSSKKANTVIVVTQDQQSKQYSFKKKIYAFQFCDKTKLCLVSNKRLEVYDIAGSKPRLSFTIRNVENIQTINNELIVFKGNSILVLNTNTREGFMQFSLGDYAYCGDATAGSRYILCLTNSKLKKVALLIDPAGENSSSIDKKVASLLDYPAIKDVSVYNNLITITPNLGELVYNQATNSFGYDPAVKQSTNSAIKQEIHRLGIDQSKYQVTNIFQ